MPNIETVFSEFEAREIDVIFKKNDYYQVHCVGKVEDESTTRVITKKCRGMVAKKRTRGTGEGTLKATWHSPLEMYHRLLDMQRPELKKGVYAYGQANLHPEVCTTADIFDEDDVEKLKAWPRCVISTGPSSSIENGVDEVAETEVEVGYMPDANGYGYYECVLSEIPEEEREEFRKQWLTDFSAELVKAAEDAGIEVSKNEVPEV